MQNLPAGNSGSNGTTLCIEDPLDSSNDVGRGSFLFYRVKSTFEDGYITLQRELGTRKLFEEPVLSDPLHYDNDIRNKKGAPTNTEGCNRYTNFLTDGIIFTFRNLSDQSRVSYRSLTFDN